MHAPEGAQGSRPARTFTVDGVRYTRRWSRDGLFGGARRLVYDVRFPLGERMRIRPAPDRVYHDLAGLDPAWSEEIGAYVRPGSRVLIMGAGTGAIASIVSALVGESGAVVSIERDGESVRYARKRYPQVNTAIELAREDMLEGEIEGSFDLAIIPRPLREVVGEGVPMDAGHIARDIMRVLRPGSRLITLRASLPDGSPCAGEGSAFCFVIKDARTRGADGSRRGEGR